MRKRSIVLMGCMLLTLVAFFSPDLLAKPADVHSQVSNQSAPASPPVVVQSPQIPKKWYKKIPSFSDIYNNLFPPAQDADGDGIANGVDNCVSVSNQDQKNSAGTSKGDACEDTDVDGVVDALDLCPDVANDASKQVWAYWNDGDACGDNDGDGIMNIEDAAPYGDYDTDYDGVTDNDDNCLVVANANQADANGNGIGDVCEDPDVDGIKALYDNCPMIANADQVDLDWDSIGDACDPNIETGTPFILAMQKLQARQITAASALFCNASGMSDERMVFGCVLTKFLLLWNAQPVVDILHAFGQPPFDVQQDLLDDGGLLHRVVEEKQTKDHLFNGQPLCYTDLPFLTDSYCGSIGSGGYTSGVHPALQKLVPKMLCSMKAQGITMALLRASVAQIGDQFAGMASMLQIGNTGNFSFVIPKELFRAKKDVRLKSQDRSILTGMLHAGAIATRLFVAYDVGLDPAKSCQNDMLQREAVLQDLNGSSGAAPTLTLLDASMVKALHPAYTAMVEEILTGLEEVKASGSMLNWNRFIRSVAKYTYGKVHSFPTLSKRGNVNGAILLFEGLEASDAGMKKLANKNQASVYLGYFFDNPPNALVAKAASQAEPFVLDTDGMGNVKQDKFPYRPVPAFWKKFLQGIVSYTGWAQ